MVGREFVRRLTAPPEFERATPTARRVINLLRVTWEWKRYRTSLRSFPLRLCIEASAACNLACPHCFTGAGEVSRPRATLSLPFFRRLLGELGKHLWQIEFHNWGEPLLNKNLPTMIAEAAPAASRRPSARTSVSRFLWLRPSDSCRRGSR